jgi:hypothetical protein
MMKTTKTATVKMTTKTVTMVVATVVFFSAVKAVNADTLLRIDTDLLIDVPSGSDYKFSFDISECSQRGDEYIQVDLYDNGYSYGMDTSERPDPMLMIARGNTVYPSTSYNADLQKWSWIPTWTQKDEDGYDTFRPYHRIVIDNRVCTEQCLSGDQVCVSTCETEKSRGDIFKGVVKNVEYFTQNRLNGNLRARCSSTPPCPEPDGKECNNKGTCTDINSNSVGVCSCVDGYGDVACDAVVTTLPNGEQQPTTGNPFLLNEKMWDYYSFEVTAPAGSESTIIVELNRLYGDPILFVKRAADGKANGGSGIVNGVPSTQDFASLADVNSFRSRLDHHHIELTNADSGLYYVGVFNNNQYLKEVSKYYLRARWNNNNAGVETPMCPFDCFGDSQGVCGADIPNGKSVCTCQLDAFGGEYCQGKVIPFDTDDHYWRGINGVIAPGEWNYIKIDTAYLPSATKDGLRVIFSYLGNGHPLLIIKYNDFPSYENADTILSSSRNVRSPTEFHITADVMSRTGVYYIGILNINYYVHEEFSYNIIINVGSSSSEKLPSFISVSLVMIFSLFVCMLIALAKRIVQNRQLARMRALRAAQIAANPELAFTFGGAGNRRVEPFRGTPQNVISRIPIVTFRGAGDEPKLDDCDYSCAVCLDEFENGDRLRQLTLCGHQFHTACLDEWLGQHDNCPLCRAPIEATSQEGGERVEDDNEQQQQQQQQQQQNIELTSVFRPSNGEDANDNRNDNNSSYSVV